MNNTPQEIESNQVFPVTFCVITNNEDADLLTGLLNTLPSGSEVCILTNMPGKEESLSETETMTIGSHTVHNRKWIYTGPFHFGKARNLSHEMATNDWIMWVDSDDRLAHCQHEVIRKLALTAKPGTGGAWAGVTSYEPASTTNPNDYGRQTSAYQLRFYRRSTGAEWEGRIHEQIHPAIQRQGWGTVATAVCVIHTGYNASLKDRIRKMQRNVDLLNVQLAECPKDYELRPFYEQALYHSLNQLYAMREVLES